MIVFYADAGWQLDLTETSITLIEENPLFFDSFFKDYTLPLTTNIEKFTSEEVRFLNLNNVKLKSTRFPGKLLIDHNFKEAYLTILSIKGKKIKQKIYYGSTIIPLLETKLKDLLFPVISFSSLTLHASSIISKAYPEVGYNFPMIIDENFKENENYDKFEGILNKYAGGLFTTNSLVLENGSNVVYNRNVVSPFPYLMEVLRFGAESAGLLLNGDFINDKVNEKIIWDTGKFIERFSTISEDEHQFSYATDEYIENGVVKSEFENIFNLGQTSTYKLKMYLKLPENIEVETFEIRHLGNVIYQNNTNSINETIEISITDQSQTGSLVVFLKTKKTDENIFIYNKFELDVSDNKLNLFPKSFSLSDVMPDWSYGKLLNKVRTWLKLKVVLDDNVLRMDYINKVLEETDYEDKSQYEIEEPFKPLPTIQLYKLMYNESDFMYIDSKGQAFNPEQYSKSEIEEIPLDVKVLPIGELDGIFTAKRSSSDPEFNLLLYDGLQTVNAEDIPIAVASVQGRSFKLDEISSLRWKPWLLFLLNAITYKDSFDCNTSEVFNIQKGQFKYNSKHIYKVIRRKRKTETIWTYTIESLTIN